MSQSSLNIMGTPAIARRVKVLAPLAVNCAYDYAVPDDMTVSIGDFVDIPLGRQTVTGVVWPGEPDMALDAKKVKAIIACHDVPPLAEDIISFVAWVADYTVSDLGAVLKLVFGRDGMLGAFRMPKDKKTNAAPVVPESYSEQQQTAITHLRDAVSAAAFSVTLLEGVTGAGKTEVYFEAIAAALDTGKQVVLMLPEIALTAQLLGRFEKRFGFTPALWHSEVSVSAKKRIWQGVLKGDVRCVIGARSALFLPYAALGLIIVDEEHDASYKQEDGVIYNARDMAIVRAKGAGFPIVLVSATPSLETIANAEAGRYAHVRLSSRFGGAAMPDISVIDMKAEKLGRSTFLSEPVRDGVRQAVEDGRQALLFLNRRGYAPLTLCGSCGYRFECPSCSAWLVDHKSKGRLQCHHCGYTARKPTNCPSCNTEDSLVACGPGVERIEEEVASFMPDARTRILASDAAGGLAEMNDAVRAIEAGEVDVIIGTQMIAKGHHFPALSFVAVVDADVGLAGADLRAGERTFQLLHQVAGRAGRVAGVKGQVMIQSYMPENKVIRALQDAEMETFFQAEMDERIDAGMPPHGRLAALIVSARKESVLDDACRALALAAPRHPRLRVLGPAPAPLAMLRGQHRRRFLIKADKTLALQKTIRDWLAAVKLPSGVKLRVDIDPQSFF